MVIGGEGRLAFHGVDRIYPATSALLGVDGQTGQAERVEVAASGSLGHLELDGHLGRGHLAASLEEQQDGHESIGTHVAILSVEPVTR